ncbi:MAG: DsbA family protein [Alphaproteobacteria bacterium]
MALGLTIAAPAHADRADEAAALPDRVLGNPDAPVTIIEYASLTCEHCAHFQKETLEQLKANYIATGKAKLIFRDYPLDGVALRVAAIARCMPEDNYHAFIGILFKSQDQWRQGLDVDTIIKAVSQYAKLGGLNDADAAACSTSDKLMDAIVAGRTKATEDYGIQATPTFIINDGADKISGAQDYKAFATIIDRTLTKIKAKGP